MFALTFQFTAAKNAMQAFNIATKANPWGALAAVIATVVATLVTFNREMDESIRLQKQANSLKQEAKSATSDEVKRIKDLVAIAKDENKSRAERNLAMKQLIDIAPEYLGKLDLENIKTLEGKKLIDQYIESLNRLKETEIARTKRQEAVDELKKIEENGPLEYNSNWNIKNWTRKKEDYANTFEEQYEKEKKMYDSMLSRGVITEENHKRLLKEMGERIGFIYENQNKLRRQKKAEIAQYDKIIYGNTEKQIAENAQKNEDNSPKEEDSKTENGKSVDKNKSTTSKKDYSSEYQNAKKARLQAEKELQKEITQGLEESLDKQLAMTEQKYNEKKFKLQQENADLHLDIQKLQEEAKTSKDPNIQKAIEEKRQLIEINKKIEVEFEKQKVAELEQVQDKWLISQHKKRIKNQERELQDLKNKRELEITELTSLEEAKKKLKEQGYKGQLSKIQTLEDAKKKLRKQANKEVLKATLNSLNLQKALVLHTLENVSGEAKDKLLEDLRKLEEQITKVKEGMLVQREEKPSNEAEKVDILGFSAKEWDDVFNHLDETSNRIRAVEMSMGALNNAFSMFSQFQQNLNEKEMRSFSANQDKKKKALLGQLNQGYISQAQYHKELQRLDEETESKKKELAVKQFKAKKAMDMANIITNTAVGVMRAYADGGILGGPLFAAIVAGIGAVQLGLVASQHPPGYARGGRTKGLGFTDDSGHEVAGVVHANEYVIPQWLRKDPEVARVEEWLEAKRTGNRQQTLGNSYSDGGRVAPADNQNYESVNQQLQNVRSATSETMLLSALERLIELLEKLDKEGIDAYIISDAKNGKELQKALKLYQELKDKNKH